MNPTLEIIAPTVEEAVEKGLAELGLTADAVEVEVLDSGSRGLFGLGTRQARIRLVVKGSEPRPEAAPSNRVAAKPAEPAVKEKPAASKPVTAAAEPVETTELAADDDEALRVARDVVQELLDKMGVRATVVARYGDPEDSRERVPLLVDIRGDDLSILIGKRAETLNALQYITGLIVGKELGRSLPLMIDVEGYRQRRASQLRQLARRMADQVAKTGRRLALEPMPAGERRIIHIELRTHPDVTTESVGEEPYRKVTIIPKE